MTRKDFYFCYSTNVQKHLHSKQIDYICIGLHPDTMRKFWLYSQSPELSEALEEYKLNTPKVREAIQNAINAAI